MKKGKAFSKENLKSTGKDMGAISGGIVASHVINSFIPRMENNVVDIAIPGVLSLGAGIGAVATKSKNPFVSLMLGGLSVASFFTASRRVVDVLATPNEEGKAILSETATGIVNKILPLGCVEDRAYLGEAEYDFTDDADFSNAEIIDDEPIVIEDQKDDEPIIPLAGEPMLKMA